MQPKYDKETDIAGPVPVMAVIEGIVEDEEVPVQADDAVTTAPPSFPRCVVIGDSSFINNANIGLSGNKDLFLNTIAWLVREENLISIRTKEDDSIPLFLNAPQQILIFTVPVLLMPLGALIIGIMVMLRLRRE